MCLGMYYVGACGSQMRALDPLAVKLKVAVRARNWTRLLYKSSDHEARFKLQKKKSGWAIWPYSWICGLAGIETWAKAILHVLIREQGDTKCRKEIPKDEATDVQIRGKKIWSQKCPPTDPTYHSSFLAYFCVPSQVSNPLSSMKEIRRNQQGKTGLWSFLSPHWDCTLAQSRMAYPPHTTDCFRETQTWVSSSSQPPSSMVNLEKAILKNFPFRVNSNVKIMSYVHWTFIHLHHTSEKNARDAGIRIQCPVCLFLPTKTLSLKTWSTPAAMDNRCEV